MCTDEAPSKKSEYRRRHRGAVKILNAEAGKWGFKLRMIMNVLPKYEATARAIESAGGAREMISLEEAKQAGLKKE